jgi:hypothetical protein
VVVVVHVVIVVVVMAITTTALHFFELLAAFVSLAAIFAISVHGLVEFGFRLMDLSFAPIIVRPCGQGCAYQSDHGQQGHAKNSDDASHFILLKIKIVKTHQESAGQLAHADWKVRCRWPSHCCI